MLVETRKMNKSMKMLYVFKHADRYKIGVTNNIERRLKQLSCGCPQITCEYHSDFIQNAYEIESYLHKLFEEFWIGGEWFSFVDLEKIRSTVGKTGIKKESNIKNIIGVEKENLLKRIFFDYYEDDLENLEKTKYENSELEKLLRNINGTDVPNQYSDLIYSILFGENTEQLRERYNAERFESFRNHLTKEQNKKIDNYYSILIGMVRLHASFEEIRNLLEKIE